MIASAADIGSVLGLVWLSYYGGRPGVNRPKILGICMLIFTVGTFAFGLPHFMTPAYDVASGAAANGTQETNKDVCASNRSTSTTCAAGQESASSPYTGVYAVLFLAQILQGIGVAPAYPLGTTYMDDYVTKRALPFYLGFSYVMYGVGPTAGLFLGGYTLSRYVDMDKGVDPAALGLSPGSPLWVGAWWLGYFVMMGVLGLVAFWLLLFPAALKKPMEENENEEENGNKMLPGTEPSSTFDPAKTLKQHAKETMLGMKKVFSNWLFMCITMAFVSYNAAGNSFSFIPKYMETQLGMHKAQASFILGLVFLPSTLFGLFASSAILRRFQLGPRGCLYMSTGCSVLALVFLVPAGFISCPRPPIAGVNIPYGHSLTANVSLGRLPGGIALTSPCNADCGCPLDRYRPVCASDGITYFSGCHARCRESQSVAGPGGIQLASYSNCGCVTSNLQSITGGSTTLLPGTQTIMVAMDESTGYFASVWATPNPENFTPDGVADTANASQTDRRTVTVTSEPNAYTNFSSSVQIRPSTSAFSIPCPTKCISSRSFLALLTLHLVFRAMVAVPIVVAGLRALSPDIKTLGIGMQTLLARVLGFIPAPIYIGALIDSSCELWSSSCGVRGACLLYDMPLNRLLFVGVQALITSASIILLCVAIHLYNRREAAEGKSQAPGLTTRDIATSMGSLASSIPSLTNIGVRNHDRYI